MNFDSKRREKKKGKGMPTVIDLDTYGMMGGEETGPAFLPLEKEEGRSLSVSLGEIREFRQQAERE